MIKITVIEREGLRSYEYLCRTEDEANLFSAIINAWNWNPKLVTSGMDIVIERESDSDPT